jgi:hypothetical protein
LRFWWYCIRRSSSQNKKPACAGFLMSGGEGGIRTLDTLLGRMLP